MIQVANDDRIRTQVAASAVRYAFLFGLILGALIGVLLGAVIS